MKFRLSSALMFVFLVAIICAWRADRSSLRVEVLQANQESARIAAELYLLRIRQCYQKPYGSLFPHGARAFVLGTGDVVDVSDAAGRADLLYRLKAGETNFRVKDPSGRVLDHTDLFPIRLEWNDAPRSPVAERWLELARERRGINGRPWLPKYKDGEP